MPAAVTERAASLIFTDIERVVFGLTIRIFIGHVIGWKMSVRSKRPAFSRAGLRLDRHERQAIVTLQSYPLALVIDALDLAQCLSFACSLASLHGRAYPANRFLTAFLLI